MSEMFEDFPDEEAHKQVVAGPIFVCSLLDKNAKKRPLLRMHGVLFANGMLMISEDAGSRSLKTIDLDDAKVTPTDTILKNFQRLQFRTKPYVFLIDLLFSDQHGKFPTIPGLGLVFAAEDVHWKRALTAMAGVTEDRDRAKAKAKRWAKRLWHRVSGSLVDRVNSEDALSFGTAEEPEEELQTSLSKTGKFGFSNFQEYLSAPMAERQRRPPTPEEFTSLLEFVDEISEDSPCWSVCTNKDEVFAMKSLDIDTGVIRVKTQGTLRNIPAAVAFECIFDTEMRTSWDKHFRFFRTVRAPELPGCSNDAHMDVIYACVHAPLGCADREFVEWRVKRKVGEQLQIYLRSCDWDQVPEVGRGRVRADVIASAYMIKPINGGADSEITIYSQVDIKGSIPKSIINTLAPSTPLKWIRKLREACQDVLRQRASSTNTIP